MLQIMDSNLCTVMSGRLAADVTRQQPCKVHAPARTKPHGHPALRTDMLHCMHSCNQLTLKIHSCSVVSRPAIDS